MTFLEIIILGYLINIISIIFLDIIFMAQNFVNLSNNPVELLQTQQLENNIKEIERLKKMSKFSEKFKNLFSFIMPFGSVLNIIILIIEIEKSGNFFSYIEDEIKRLKQQIEEDKK